MKRKIEVSLFHIFLSRMRFQLRLNAPATSWCCLCGVTTGLMAICATPASELITIKRAEGADIEMSELVEAVDLFSIFEIVRGVGWDPE